MPPVPTYLFNIHLREVSDSDLKAIFETIPVLKADNSLNSLISNRDSSFLWWRGVVHRWLFAGLRQRQNVLSRRGNGRVPVTCSLKCFNQFYSWATSAFTETVSVCISGIGFYILNSAVDVFPRAPPESRLFQVTLVAQICEENDGCTFVSYMNSVSLKSTSPFFVTRWVVGVDGWVIVVVDE